jgi:hypothetical protein
MAGGEWTVPERWLQFEIARAFADTGQYYVYLEHPVTSLQEYAGTGLPLQGNRQIGKVDIALYDLTPDPQDASLSSIIELKSGLHPDGFTMNEGTRMPNASSPSLPFGKAPSAASLPDWLFTSPVLTLSARRGRSCRRSQDSRSRSCTRRRCEMTKAMR